jgi:uncharacterized phage-associated protein
MATVFDIANFFITAENKREQGSMTNLRLNKIHYFAQIISLLENGRPLFLDDFEAWDLGPVIPSVYRKYKAYENTPIQEPETIDYSAFTAEEIRLLFDVYSLYKNISTSRLVHLSHYRNGPWHRAYTKGRGKKVIPLKEIEQFYRQAYVKNKFPRRSEQLLSLIPEAELLPID